MKVSVIIPIFDTEQHLERCLDSVCAQTLHDIEIICVNDASPGNAMKILDAYARGDKRIRVIDLGKNRGVSIARNMGIAACAGAGLYIGFVDSDDSVDADFYEKLFQAAHSAQYPDIVSAPVCNWSGQKEAPRACKQNESWFYSSIYKTEFILGNGIEFSPHIVRGEDLIFMCDTMLAAKSVKKIDNTFYNYYSHGGTASHKNFDIFLSSIHSVGIKIKNALDSSIINEIHGLAIVNFFIKFFFRQSVSMMCPSNLQSEAVKGMITFFHLFDNYLVLSAGILKEDIDDLQLREVLKSSDMKKCFDYCINKKKSIASNLRNNFMLQKNKLICT